MVAVPGIFHPFVSSVPDDPTLPGAVKPQAQWNAPHDIIGGEDGDLFIRDSTAPSGFSLQAPPLALTGRLLSYTEGTQSILGSGSPTIDLVNLAFSIQKAGSTILIVTQAAAIDNLATYHNVALTTFLDNTSFNILNLVASNSHMVFFNSVALTVGTHTLKGRFSTTTPPLSGTLYFFVFEFG